MAETFGTLFQESRGVPVNVDGKLIHAWFGYDLGNASALRIQRICHDPAVAQGLRVKAAAGDLLTVNGQSLRDFVLWTDTSPVEVRIEAATGAVQPIKLWNTWRYEGSSHGWIGNAGMLIHEIDDSVELHCSHGIGPPDFSNLVVRISPA